MLSSDNLYQRALGFLARREHSRFELARKLQKIVDGADASDADIPAILQRLESEGYLSDARFVEMYCLSRTRKGFGPYRIEQGLMAKGVAPSLVTAGLQPWAGQWQDLAKLAWQKKYKGQQALDRDVRAKQWRFLQQRGFLPEHCKFL